MTVTTVVTRTAPPADGRPAPAHHFRPDIEGLRAVAVLLVVLSHAGVGAVAGGYVGVDVFFVISGFLITSLLIREVRRTGRISLSRFYARRALRLLPASTLVLAVTLVGTYLWLTPLRFTEFARDAAAGAAYVSNLRFADIGTDYLASAESPSPFQHLWSLAVEEQFYLVWPALILALTWRRFSPRVLAVVLSVLVAVSLVLSVTETARSAPWAYFGPHTRMWELGLGALVALGAGRLTRLAPWLSTTMGWAGLAAIGVAAFTFDSSTAFPGYAALLPVTGAALVLAGGCAVPSAVLSVAPLQWIGRLSYGWYLWHWPVLMIGPAALGVRAGLGVNLLLCAGALVLAAVSLVLVENPVREHAELRARPWRGLAVGGALSAGAAVVALLMSLAPPTVKTGAAAQDVPAALTASADPARTLADLIAGADLDAAVPANLTPPLKKARADVPHPYAVKCHLGVVETAPPAECAYGDPAGTTTVVLFGDSHAAQWFPTLERIAAEQGWRLLLRTKSSCSAADTLAHLTMLKRAYTECQTWRRAQFAAFRANPPDLVVVSSSFNTERPTGVTGDETPAWQAGWRRTMRALALPRTKVAFLVDTPFRSQVPSDCLAANATRPSLCVDPVGDTLRRPEVRAVAAAEAVAAGATVIDPLPWLCAAACPVVLGNQLVYRDTNHMTTGYARMLAPLLFPRLPRPVG
jgi:peptidoglycan/LPS O-acetylase OafA/YrhL